MNFTSLSTRSSLSTSTHLRIFVVAVSLVLLAIAPTSVGLADRPSATSALNEPANRPAQEGRDDCAETAELRVLLSRDLTTIAFPRIPTTVSGTKSALVKTTCPDVHHIDNRLPSFAWKLEAPPGSASRLQNTTTLTVTFTPDRVGRYIVKLIACPQTCKLLLLAGHTPQGKPRKEQTEVGPVERAMTIDVAAEAQIPPLYTPAPLPSLSAATLPERYAAPRTHCGSSVEIGIGDSAQWYTTDTFDPATPLYKVVEGRVYHALVSRKDHPASHHSNDTNAFVEVDPPFRHLLVDDTPEDRSTLLPVGGMEVEWEEREWPEAFRPVTGDRISALGFHVIDCGHDKYTEIHPAIAVAVHRPRAVVLPARVRFQDSDAQTQPTGGNVVVPGIVTDLWASLRGGQALDCDAASLHQPVFTTLPNGLKVHATCVKQPTTNGVNFEFNIFLPENPVDRLRDLGLTLPVRPALFFDIQNHPDAAALGARSDVGVTVVERHTDGPTPFVKVRVALSQMKTGEKFAKRFVAAWVYPDYTTHNFGLRTLRVKLDHLSVSDDGDPFLKGDGDWHFWAVFPGLAHPWTKLIDCDGCVEEKTYTPQSSIFRRGAFDADGALQGEVLLFDRQFGSLQFTGYEGDVLTSDDVGSVFEPINNAPATRNATSKCNDQTVGGLNDIDPSTSGCAAYGVQFEFVAGRQPTTATFSPEMNRFAQQLLVRAEDRKRMPDVVDTDLFTFDRAVNERTQLIVGKRGDLEVWQETVTTAKLQQEMRSGNPEPMIKDLRKHVQELLGPQPTEKHRRKVALELQELKKSIPPALYQKYLCDLETGKPCTGP